MIKILRSQRGYMLFNVIILTLITSFAAMILLNAATRVRNPDSTLRLTALYLAKEQFAMIESLAAKGEQIDGDNFLGDPNDLTTNLGKDNRVDFTVETHASGNTVKVIVKWKVGEKNFQIESERKILIAKKN